MPRVSRPFTTIVAWCGDNSGSMRSMGNSPAEGAEEFIKTHQDLDTPSSKIYLHFATFNGQYNVVFSDYINQITPEIIQQCIDSMTPGGQTCLYDAVTQCCGDLATINNKIINGLSNEAKRLNPHIPISFTLMTDGYDTCSLTSNASTMRKSIQDTRKKGHTFFFLGANQNAIEKGSQYGFDPSTSLQVGSDPRYSLGAFRSLTQASARCVSGSAPNFIPLERNQSSSAQEAALYSGATFTPPTSPLSTLPESKQDTGIPPFDLGGGARNNSCSNTPPQLIRSNNKPPPIVRNIIQKNKPKPKPKCTIQHGPPDEYGRTEYWTCSLCTTINPGDLSTWGNTKCSLCQSFP